MSPLTLLALLLAALLCSPLSHARSSSSSSSLAAATSSSSAPLASSSPSSAAATAASSSSSAAATAPSSSASAVAALSSSSSLASAASSSSSAASGGGGGGAVPSTVSGQIPLGYYVDFTQSSAETVTAESAYALHCNPIQQFVNLPADGAQLVSFQTYVDLSLTTVTAAIRFALYLVDGLGVYTLVAGTDANSDVQVGPGAAIGPTVVSTTAPLLYPSGASSYTVLPTSNYSLCFIDNGGAQLVPGTSTNGTVAVYGWVEGDVYVSNVELTPYSITQPLPSSLVPTGTSSNTYAVWMTVTAPVVTYSFVYGLQGSFDGTSATFFTVCAIGTFLVSPVQDVDTGAHAVWHVTGTRSFSNGSESVVETIIGLAPFYTAFASNLLYPDSAPYVDAGGVSYAVQGVAILPGGYIYENYYSGENPFVNIYENYGVLLEDGYNLLYDDPMSAYINQTGVGIVLSPPNSDLVYSCAVLDGAAPQAPSAPGGGSSSSSAAVPSAASSSTTSATSAAASSSSALAAASSSFSGGMSSAASSSSLFAASAASSSPSSAAAAAPSSAASSAFVTTAASSSLSSSAPVVASSAAPSSSTAAGAATSAPSSSAATGPFTVAASSSTAGVVAASSSTAAAASSSPAVLVPTSSINPTSAVSPSSAPSPSSASSVVTPAPSSTAAGTTGGGSTILTSAASSVRGSLATAAAAVAVIVLLA